MAKLWRLTPIAALTVAVALLLASLAIAWENERTYKAQKIQEANVDASILAASVSAALAFGDRAVAREFVNALQADPTVRAAAVYTTANEVFVGFNRDENDPLPPSVTPEEAQFVAQNLVVKVPIQQGSMMLGVVYLRTATETTNTRVARYSGIVLLVVMAAVMVGVLGAAQTALSRANRELEQHASELASANAQLRTEMEERAKVEEALRQAQKMDAIGQLTGGVAHDFNNLLTVIIGTVDMLQKRLRTANPDLVRLADAARRGADRAASLTQRLLAFARRQPLDPKPINPNKLVAGMEDLLRRTLGERIAIETVLGAGIWRVSADPNQLESAILNLAVNARDAMPEGGKLTIEASNTFLDQAYAVANAEVTPGQYVMIAVSDTGTGMAPDVVEKAFEPFFTTKETGQGVGLGLSQVFGFLKQSGGHVKIYSEPGQGTTVKLYLPRIPASELADEPVPAKRQPNGTGAGTVLVVEDNEDVRLFAAEVLGDIGYHVLTAGDAKEALAVLDKGLKIDLLFTDVGLPGMNGRLLAEEASRRRPMLKILFMTGYARNAIVHHGRLDPGVALIVKPFTEAELSVAIRAALEGPPGLNGTRPN